MVTVVFADLVGYSALSERLDPERVKRLIDASFERLIADITAFGGRVDKVLGDGILALFGAPVAHEDDADRAIRAALQMHESLARFVSELDRLGLEILVTELDVIDWRLPAEIATRDMMAARQVKAFLEAVGSAKLPSSIVTWGLTDKYSWIGETFRRDDRLAARPLPFDAAYRPKPMWRAIEEFCAARA